MTKYEREEAQKRNQGRWEQYMGGSDRDLALKGGVPDEKEYHVHLTRSELDNGDFRGKVLIEVDKLTHYTHGTLTLELPEDIGGQNQTMHQPVSGVIYKTTKGLPKGCRVFFHYNEINNAKQQKNNRVGLFVICEDKPYLVLNPSQLYMAIIDGQPVALHADFCVTEAIERTNVETVVAPDGVKFLGTMSAGGILLGEDAMTTKTYEPFTCKVVSLPSKAGMDEHRLEAFEKYQMKDGQAVIGAVLKEGDTVYCRKSWDLPLDNSIQKFLGDRKLFRTRITAILEII